MADTRIKNLPENVDLLVLDGSGELQTDVGLEELPYHLSDPGALVWCDVSSIEGGQDRPYGRLLREVFGFDELTIEDCFTRSHLPKVDIYDECLFMALFSFHLFEKRRRVKTDRRGGHVRREQLRGLCSPRPLRELDRDRGSCISFRV